MSMAFPMLVSLQKRHDSQSAHTHTNIHAGSDDNSYAICRNYCLTVMRYLEIRCVPHVNKWSTVASTVPFSLQMNALHQGYCFLNCDDDNDNWNNDNIPFVWSAANLITVFYEYLRRVHFELW